MQTTVRPANGLAPQNRLGREALESLAIEGYRSGILSHAQASQLLSLSEFQFDGFLKDRHIHDRLWAPGEACGNQDGPLHLSAGELLQV